jgi:hypothetical protein
MPTVYKVLGQAAPANTSETTLYTVPSATSAIVSTLAIANLTSSVATATVNVKIAAAAASNANTLLKTVNISPLSTSTLTLGITLAATDVISVTSGTANALSFQAFGSEIS